MNHNAFGSRLVLNAVKNRVAELQLFAILEVDWRAEEELCQFLKVATAATEPQSDPQFVTVSIKLRFFRKSQKSWIKAIFSGDPVLTSVAEVVIGKLNNYVEKYAQFSLT